MFFEETREGTLVIEAHKVGNLLKACRKARDRLFLLFHFVWTEFMVQHDDVQKSKKPPLSQAVIRQHTKEKSAQSSLTNASVSSEADYPP